MKKKVIKPFDVNQVIHNDCKAETKCGYPVKSLMTDAIYICNDWSLEGMPDFPIMAILVTPKGIRIAFYTIEGKFYAENKSDLDLVLVEEQEIPSVTKEEFEAHIEWLINHVSDTVEELDKKVGEYFKERLLQETIRDYIKESTEKTQTINNCSLKQLTDTQNDKVEDEEVKCWALKLEYIEDEPNEEIAKAYVKDAVGTINHALGYSSKERNAFSWKKIWDNKGCFGMFKKEEAERLIKQCPDFKFKLYYYGKA